MVSASVARLAHSTTKPTRNDLLSRSYNVDINKYGAQHHYNPSAYHNDRLTLPNIDSTTYGQFTYQSDDGLLKVDSSWIPSTAPYTPAKFIKSSCLSTLKLRGAL